MSETHPRGEGQPLEDLLAANKASADSSAQASQQQTEQPPVEALQQGLQEAQKQALLAQAELENFRKRVRREMEEEKRFANLPLIADLLHVIDNLQRAIDSAEQTPGGAGLLEGVKMVAAQVQGVLEKYGCQRIEAAGQSFDPNRHEAIAQQPTSEVPPGVVTDELTAGYRLHDRVVRPSQVVVSVAAENES